MSRLLRVVPSRGSLAWLPRGTLLNQDEAAVVSAERCLCSAFESGLMHTFDDAGQGVNQASLTPKRVACSLAE